MTEWAGKRVKSLKRGIKTARLEAGISKTVSPHILRHSAAVHMAEDRRSMEEKQQFLGHSDINVTRKIYARASHPAISKKRQQRWSSTIQVQ